MEDTQTHPFKTIDTLPELFSQLKLIVCVCVCVCVCACACMYACVTVIRKERGERMGKEVIPRAVVSAESSIISSS